jgi:hypothetical protein
VDRSGFDACAPLLDAVFAAARSRFPRRSGSKAVYADRKERLSRQSLDFLRKKARCGIRAADTISSVLNRHRGSPLRTHASRTGVPMISANNVSASWHASGCSLTTEASGQLKPRMTISSPVSSSSARPPRSCKTSTAFFRRFRSSASLETVGSGALPQAKYPREFDEYIYKTTEELKRKIDALHEKYHMS